MIRPKTNRIASTVALASAGLAAIVGCLSFIAGSDIPVLAKSERSSAVVDSVHDSSATNSTRSVGLHGDRTRVNRAVGGSR